MRATTTPTMAKATPRMAMTAITPFDSSVFLRSVLISVVMTTYRAFRLKYAVHIHVWEVIGFFLGQSWGGVPEEKSVECKNGKSALLLIIAGRTGMMG